MKQMLVVLSILIIGTTLAACAAPPAGMEPTAGEPTAADGVDSEIQGSNDDDDSQSDQTGAGDSEIVDSGPLILAFIPQENPEKLLGDIKEITGYLSAELVREVEGFVTQDHAAAVEALRNGDADVSFMGALPYVLAHDQTGAEVILAEVYRGSPVYTGRIFVRADSGIETLADLEGKSIAFADPISESGYLYPLDEFVQAGLLERGADPQSFFSTVYFAGGYQQSLQAVINGFVDAAGASQYAELLVAPEQLEQLIWIGESDPIPSHVVLVRQGLNPDLVESFKQAMLQLNEAEYSYLLRYVYSPDGYVEATHADYASVEDIARLYGFIK